MAVTMGMTMTASTRLAIRKELAVAGPPKGFQPKMLMPPSVAASQSSAGRRKGTSTVRPHRPNSTDGKASSRLTNPPTGPRRRRGRNTLVASARPMEMGTAMTSAMAEVISVP